MRHNRLRALSSPLVSPLPPSPFRLSPVDAWPLVELVGQAGNYDYVEFTAEYSALRYARPGTISAARWS